MKEMEKDNSPSRVSVMSLKEINEHLRLGHEEDGNNFYACPFFSVSVDVAVSMKEIIATRTPLRLNMMRIIMLTEGHSDPVISFHNYHLEPGELLFVNFGAIIGSESIVPDVIFKGIAIDPEFLKEIYGKNLPHFFLQSGLNFKLKLSEEELAIFDNYLRTLLSIVKMPNPDPKAVNMLFASVLNLTHSLYERERTNNIDFCTSKSVLTDRFTRLVVENAQQEHELAFYANQLCVTPHYLGVVVKQETGETAKDWIDKAIVTDLKVELKFTDKPLKKLASEFGFSSISSISKFFKRLTGISPNEFRQEQQRI